MVQRSGLIAGPLSESELDMLDQLLMETLRLENAMDISMLDGFLTAIVIGPNVIPPSAWIPWVWDCEAGKAKPYFKNEKIAKRTYELIFRHMNDIARTLHEAPADYEPLLMENSHHGDPIPIIDEWCYGFMRGVAMDSIHWAPLTTSRPELFKTLRLYGTEEGFAELQIKKYSLRHHKTLARGLADTVQQIHAHWLSLRSPQPRH